ncbi:MAG TPA: hypothetical protein VFD41_11505 [Actinomycetales bacterium]|nr:hypothetical protein [Actinomycetales bacterium]
MTTLVSVREIERAARTIGALADAGELPSFVYSAVQALDGRLLVVAPDEADQARVREAVGDGVVVLTFERPG